MELWIRSQERKHLIKCEAIIYEETGTGYGLRAFTKNYGFNIARYKTKKRVLEVLDEIQQYISLPNIDNSAYIYQMPEE